MKLHPITEWLAAKPDRSIAALARAAGVSRQSLHSVCGGYRNRLGADACRRLSEATGISRDTLLDWQWGER